MSAMAYQHGLFSRYNFLTGHVDAWRGNHRLLLYGELLTGEQQLISSAKASGLVLERVEDCSVSQASAKGIEDYNRVMIGELNGLLGSGWYEKFMNNPKGQKGKEWSCKHTNLSSQFSLQSRITRYPVEGSFDSCRVDLTVWGPYLEKTHLELVSMYFFSGVFTDCTSVRSWSTGFNKDKAVEDNDYGDIVVADLNFDGKDDLAVKKDSGGNGGPMYSFYLQLNGRFHLNPFLTDSICYFPEPDASKKILVTHVHANAMEMARKEYAVVHAEEFKLIKKEYLPY